MGQTKNYRHKYWLGFGLVIIFLICCFYPYLISLYTNLHIRDFSRLGAFGDSFGALNALFSGFAFLGLVYAILQQKEELKLTREDLKNQQEGLKLTRKEITEQTKVFQQQTFENTFFHMLKLYNEIVNSFEFFQNGDPQIYKSRQASQRWVNDITSKSVKSYRNKEETSLKKVYPDICQKFFPALASYLGIINSILKLIDNSQLKNKQDYINILQSCLSKYELALIYYYCSCDLGIEMNKLVKKYKIDKKINEVVNDLDLIK